jgi:hypothetical protein
VNGLRRLADFFELNGSELPEFILDPSVDLQCYVTQKEEMVTAARIMARGSSINNPLKKEQTTFAYELNRSFGKNVRLQVWTSRETVCERVQVGTELKPVTKVETVETGEMTEVPVYEWNCTDSLLTTEL